MAKKIPPEQVNKRNRDTLRSLVQLMKDIDQKYSIKVGIIGKNGSAQVPDSDLTYAELGAIHEFGATINVTKKMRGYFWHKWGIHKSNNPIVIPTRSFLRQPLLNDDAKEYFINEINRSGLIHYEADALGKDKEGRQLVRELNIEHAREALLEDAGIMEKVANEIAASALWLVQQAFKNGGYGTNKWAPITELTKQNRKHDPESPPLQDSGDLMQRITAEVKKVK